MGKENYRIRIKLNNSFGWSESADIEGYFVMNYGYSGLHGYLEDKRTKTKSLIQGMWCYICEGERVDDLTFLSIPTNKNYELTVYRGMNLAFGKHDENGMCFRVESDPCGEKKVSAKITVESKEEIEKVYGQYDGPTVEEIEKVCKELAADLLESRKLLYDVIRVYD